MLTSTTEFTHMLHGKLEGKYTIGTDCRSSQGGKVLKMIDRYWATRLSINPHTQDTDTVTHTYANSITTKHIQ